MCFSGARRANTIRGILIIAPIYFLAQSTATARLFNTSHRWRIELGLHSMFSTSLRRRFVLQACFFTYRAPKLLNDEVSRLLLPQLDFICDFIFHRGNFYIAVSSIVVIQILMKQQKRGKNWTKNSCGGGISWVERKKLFRDNGSRFFSTQSSVFVVRTRQTCNFSPLNSDRSGLGRVTRQHRGIKETFRESSEAMIMLKSLAKPLILRSTRGWLRAPARRSRPATVVSFHWCGELSSGAATAEWPRAYSPETHKERI